MPGNPETALCESRAQRRVLGLAIVRCLGWRLSLTPSTVLRVMPQHETRRVHRNITVAHVQCTPLAETVLFQSDFSKDTIHVSTHPYPTFDYCPPPTPVARAENYAVYTGGANREARGSRKYRISGAISLRSLA